jgi:hypothetical protein
MTATAVGLGVKGAIIDGGIRDTHQILEKDFPVFYKHRIPNGSLGRCLITHYQCPIKIGDVVIKLGDVDLDREQIAHGVAVFGPVQPVEGHGSSGLGIHAGGRIELGLGPADQRIAVVDVEHGRIGRRHHAGAELADQLLPGLGVGGGIVEIDGFEVQARDLLDRVMAIEAMGANRRGVVPGSIATEATAGRDRAQQRDQSTHPDFRPPGHQPIIGRVRMPRVSGTP